MHEKMLKLAMFRERVRERESMIRCDTNNFLSWKSTETFDVKKRKAKKKKEVRFVI